MQSLGHAHRFAHVPRRSAILAMVWSQSTDTSDQVFEFLWELIVRYRSTSWKTRGSWSITSDCNELNAMFYPPMIKTIGHRWREIYSTAPLSTAQKVLASKVERSSLDYQPT